MVASDPGLTAAGSMAVVLLSGGLDSATVLAMARARGYVCHTLAFDYGQRHRRELACAARVAASMGAASHRVVGVDLRAVGGSALTADIGVPKDRTAGEMGAGVPVTYVPARNLVFLSIAAGLAEVLGAGSVWIGINAVDYSGYPDCRGDFVEAFERVAALATQAGREGRGVRVMAPLVSMSKAEIIRAGVVLGVDYGLTSSCYDPVGVGGARAGRGEGADEGRGVGVGDEVGLACGRCDACVIRREGFRGAGVVDPTRYAADGAARGR